MDLMPPFPGRIALVFNQILEDFVFVFLHDIRDPAIAESEQTSSVSHGRIAKRAGDVEFLEVGEFLLYDLNATSDVPGSHVRQAIRL